jgi:hypothetical protein
LEPLLDYEVGAQLQVPGIAVIRDWLGLGLVREC